MKKVNFNIKIYDLLDKEVENFNTRESVANILASGRSTHPIRMYELAKKINEKGVVELLSEDFQRVKSAIEASDRISDLVKAQILIAMDQAKDVTVKK